MVSLTASTPRPKQSGPQPSGTTTEAMAGASSDSEKWLAGTEAIFAAANALAVD